MKSSVLKGWKPNALTKGLFNNLVDEQTRRLVAYAKETIQLLGDTIQTYHSKNHMDRNGNLLNSLCWGVAYDGSLIESGYYREANSIKESFLHEWSWGGTFYVDGHAEAENYLQKYGAKGSNGCWRVFFAILAPYWGYWEEGFTFKGKYKNTFLQFSVMSQIYDKVTKDLKPANVNFKITKSIKYTMGWDYLDRKGRKVHVKGSLDKWNEHGLYQSRRGKTKRR